MVAVFEIGCCGRLLVSGRFRGSDMYPPTKQVCPFGCADTFHPSGKAAGHVLHFKYYASEDLLEHDNPALLATWKFRDRTYLKKIDRPRVREYTYF